MSSSSRPRTSSGTAERRVERTSERNAGQSSTATSPKTRTGTGSRTRIGTRIIGSVQPRSRLANSAAAATAAVTATTTAANTAMADVVEAANRDCVDFVRILPVGATEEILSYLSARDLRACSAVSTDWHEICNSSWLWRRIAKEAHIRNYGIEKQIEKDQLIAINSNYLNPLYQFRVPKDMGRLSPMNDWKLFHCQNNFLLYRWDRGFFAGHFLPLPKLSYKNPPNMTEVTFPSKLPKDRIFLPYQYRNNYRATSFCLLRLDGEPRIACELEVGVVPIACVDRDCVVLVHRRRVETVKLDKNNATPFTMITVGELFSEDDCDDEETYNDGKNYFLNMDDDVIVAGFKYSCIKVWCKATHSLRKAFFNPLQEHYFSCCHFQDSTLYFSSWTPIMQLGPEAGLKIWDLKEDIVKTIEMDREVTKMLSNQRYFLTVTILEKEYETCHLIEVRERDDYDIVTTVEQNIHWNPAPPVVLLCGENVLYVEGISIKVISLSLNTVSDVCEVDNLLIGMDKLGGDLLMVRLKDTVEVWDWKMGMRLHTPVLQCRRNYKVYCDDTRIVVVNPNNEVNVIGFW